MIDVVKFWNFDQVLPDIVRFLYRNHRHLEYLNTIVRHENIQNI